MPLFFVTRWAIIGTMGLVDARDVLDPDGKTLRSFQGRVVGHYERTGANSWDPYKFVRQDGGAIEVLPGLKIQLERSGARFRMRKQGKVIRVEWVPSGEAAGESPMARRARFLQRYVETFDEAAGMATGFLASKLLK